MSKWITRRDLEGKIVGPSVLCLEQNQAAQANGVKTIDAYIASLLEPHEIVEGCQGLRKIYARGQIAGFIEVSADCPPDSRDATTSATRNALTDDDARG